MNKEVRRDVFARANGRCECGCRRPIDFEYGRLDHFFGRAKAEETVVNCWALAPPCDDAKTRNSPSATHWLHKFVVHCALATLSDPQETRAYFEAMDRAMTKLAVLRQKLGETSL